ncbi:hypothetical protein ACHAW6_000559 [Cyclotella cf. meneghiniana]
MHPVCGYTVKSTWVKAAQAGNFIGWPLLTTKNIQKYYPDTTETPTGHLNQTCKNTQSTKPKPVPLKTFHSTHFKGRKVQDMFTKVYDVHESSPIKPENSPSAPNLATSTSWSLWKSTQCHPCQTHQKQNRLQTHSHVFFAYVAPLQSQRHPRQTHSRQQDLKRYEDPHH